MGRDMSPGLIEHWTAGDWAAAALMAVFAALMLYTVACIGVEAFRA